MHGIFNRVFSILTLLGALSCAGLAQDELTEEDLKMVESAQTPLREHAAKVESARAELLTNYLGRLEELIEAARKASQFEAALQIQTELKAWSQGSAGPMDYRDAALPRPLRQARYEHDQSVARMEQAARGAEEKARMQTDRLLKLLEEGIGKKGRFAAAVEVGKIRAALAEQGATAVAAVRPNPQGEPPPNFSDADSLRKWLQSKTWKFENGKKIAFKADGKVIKSWGIHTPEYKIQGREISFESNTLQLDARGTLTAQSGEYAAAGPGRRMVDPLPNLLKNSGAEEPVQSGKIPHWDMIGPQTWVPGGDGKKIFGDAHFHPGVNPKAELSQVVDVNKYQLYISKGLVFRASAEVAGHEGGDTAMLILEFLDAKRESLEVLKTEPFTSKRVWKTVTVEAEAPNGTRYVRVGLFAVRKIGSYNNGYFDEVKLFAVPPGR